MKQFLVLFLLAATAFAVERGIMIRPAQIYISPDATAAKLGELERGREVAFVEAPVNGWAHVLASVTNERDVTGWILDKGIIRPSTPNGDRIVYGEAVSSESEASRRAGRKGADRDAMRLYARMAEYFPESPLAGEALYRAADIRWQLEKGDVMSRPSARQQDPNLRIGMEEHFMKEVMKKYPRTKWADLAAYQLLDNKLCGDWRGESKCPEKETEIYTKYADEHPQSPRAPEALYNAAWRQAALLQIYPNEGKQNKLQDAKVRAVGLAQRVISNYSNSTDWLARAQTLLYQVQNNMPVYGNQLQ